MRGIAKGTRDASLAQVCKNFVTWTDSTGGRLKADVSFYLCLLRVGAADFFHALRMLEWARASAAFFRSMLS
jgi:hypothetical protein